MVEREPKKISRRKMLEFLGAGAVGGTVIGIGGTVGVTKSFFEQEPNKPSLEQEPKKMEKFILKDEMVGMEDTFKKTVSGLFDFAEENNIGERGELPARDKDKAVFRELYFKKENIIGKLRICKGFMCVPLLMMYKPDPTAFYIWTELYTGYTDNEDSWTLYAFSETEPPQQFHPAPYHNGFWGEERGIVDPQILAPYQMEELLKKTVDYFNSRFPNPPVANKI